MESLHKIFKKQQDKSLWLRRESYRERKGRLKTIESWILSHKEEIRDALYKDMKKAPHETDLSEIYTVLTEIREASRYLKRWMQPHHARTSLTYLGTRASTIFEPKGVCLIIAPWNYPFNLAMGPVVSALAAGNTFILKPSEYTMHTSTLISGMVSECFPEEIGFVVEGGASVAQELLQLPFDHVFFTGSADVGKLIMQAAAKHLSSVTLELGGKSPVIVDQTAHLKDAAKKIAWGKWLNAGQTCVAPDYLFVHQDVMADFIIHLKQEAETRFREEDYTAIVNEKHFERQTTLKEDAIKNGAEILLEVKGSDNKKIYPLLLEGINEKMKLSHEEIFGPILPIKPYKSLEEVIDYIGTKPKPLSLYIFSKSKRNIQQVTSQTSAGTMVINDCVLQFSHPSLPFGGVNSSGFGKSHGRHGFMAFSNEKALLKQRIGFTMAQMLYPPYTELKSKVIKLLIKYF